MPKATIEAAIARGQGKSSSGTDLESLTIGAIMPPSVALIIDLETESKLRALKEINVMIKKAGGTPTPTKFYFSRVGRVVFEPSAQVSLADDVLDDAIEAGAEDLENDEEGRILVWSQPNRTMEICKAVGEKHALGIVDSTIVWSPNKDTMAALHREADANALAELLGALRKYPEVHAIYSNVVKGTISEERWAAVEANIDV